MTRPPPSRWAWLAGLLLHAALLAVLVRVGPPGWIAALPLLIVLPWLVRRSRYAHAVNGLLVVWYAGFGLAFRDLPAGMAVAWLGAGAFVAMIVFVRMDAVEERRGR